MAIFDEPSRKPLPQPTFEDVEHAGQKGLVSMIPIIGSAGAELLGLLSSPVAARRDAWLEDLERRLRELEATVEGFRFEKLRQNEQFVSATLQATQVALRTHQTEKREALRNALLNVAVAREDLPPDDLQFIFLNLVDRFTPTHLQILSYISNRTGTPKPQVPNELSNQVVQDLNNQGLLKDKRPYIARNRDYSDLLSVGWEVSPLGAQFLQFIQVPEARKR